MLKPGKVLAVGSILGDRGGKEVPVVVTPGLVGEVGALVANALLVDFEPVSRSVVGLHIVTRGPREVDKAGACF